MTGETRKLDRALVSMLQNVELHKRGWDEKLYRSLVIASYLLSGNRAMTPEEACKVLLEQGIRVQKAMFFKMFDHMRKHGPLVGDASGKARLSQKELSKINDEIRRYQDTVNEARQVFLSHFDVLDESVAEKIWEKFDEFLQNAALSLGVKFFEIVQRSSLKVTSEIDIDSFCRTFDAKIKETVLSAVTQFLESNHSSVSRYLLSLLDAGLAINACGLSEQDLKTLTERYGVKASIKLFLDTNVVFCLLGLHAHPWEEATKDVLDFIQQQKQKGLHVKLHVTNDTLEEAKSVIRHMLNTLRPLGKVPWRVRGFLSGVAARAIEEARKINTTPEKWLTPYLEGLTHLLEDKGITIYNNPRLLEVVKEEDVNDLINESREMDEELFEKRGYNSVKHDVTLWALCRRLQTNILERKHGSVEKTWVLSVDYRFLHRFDKSQAIRRRQEQFVIDPAGLSRLLSFWFPPDENMKRVLLSSLRSYLFFEEFDKEREQQILDMLAIISRYEDAGDIPEKVIINMCQDEKLTAKVGSAESDEEKKQIVKQRLSVELGRMKQELENLRKQRDDLQKQLTIAADRVRKYQEEKQAAKVERRRMEEKIKRLEQKIEEMETQRKRRADFWRNVHVSLRLGLLWVLFLTAALSWSLYGLHVISGLPNTIDVKIGISVVLVSLVFWLCTHLSVRGLRNVGTHFSTRVLKMVEGFKKIPTWLLLVIISGAIACLVARFIGALLE
ncbi:MAG: hypothetical protein DRP82_01920 [Planctomycetota bacterium]|nr:MAG: hypothetical protein DRP82_01920 [Planctomycetota bacterium]